MAVFQQNDVTIYFEQHGKGPDLVLIAGLSADVSFWQKIVPILSQHYRVTVFDNRGVGRSTQTIKHFSIEDMAADTLSLLKYLGITKAHIVGHSMGGAILQMMLKIAPEVINMAMLVCSLACLPIIARMHVESVEEVIALGAPLSLIEKIVLPWIYSESLLKNKECLDEEIHYLTHQAVPQSKLALHAQISAVEGFDMTKDLALITHPVVVVVSDEDILTPMSLSREICDLLPNAKLEMIHGAGHMLPREKADELTNLILKYCN